MVFWTYMLHCRDRTLYVGHTDDLEVRMAQHEQGKIGGYTARKRPVNLVWCAEFPTRYEALQAERQIKGWRKAKKLALIRGDWDLISYLGKGKERPSTGSGRTEEGGGGQSQGAAPPVPGSGQAATPATVRPELVESRYFLLRHPSSQSQTLQRLAVSVIREGDVLQLSFTGAGEIDHLRIPEIQRPERADELWRHTCFEAFLRHPDGSYWEFNFSPSSRWASYSFTAYRDGMQPLAVPSPPQIDTHIRPKVLRLNASLKFPPGVFDQARLNLTAVIEEISGHKSYWALAHPPEGPPDFHDPACFVLELPPAPAS